MLGFQLSHPEGRPLRLLCVGAHCDDIEIGCGGTLLKLIRSAPVSCHWVILAGNGERAAEARRSAEAFLQGAAETCVQIESFRDGFLPFNGGAVKDCFEALKQAVEPDVIFTHYRDDRHQDHRLVSDLTWNTFRDHVILEYEIPKYDGDLGAPNVFVPLSDELCRRKVEGLMQFYGSQRRRPWFTAETFRSLLRLRGIEAASLTGYAEAFYGRKLLW